MRQGQALVIGDRRDVHLSAVVESVRAMGGPEPVVFDAQTLAKEPYVFVEGQRFTIAGAGVEFARCSRGWLRRSSPTLWGAGLVTGSLDAVRHRAFLSLVGSLARVGGVEWLTGVDSMLRAEDRLLQLEVVRQLGYRTPITVVTSSGAEAREVLGDSFVVKPLNLGYYTSSEGPRAVFSTEIHAVDLCRVDFADAPFVAQERISAVEHLRIVTVGGDAWVASLASEGRPLDWRRQEEAHGAWVPKEDVKAAASAVDVARSFDLGYSSQDWIHDGSGDAVFVDLNPGGQWLFLPDEVSNPVTQAIGQFLSAGAP